MQKVLKIWILMMLAVTLLLTACINDDFPEDDGTDAAVNGEEPTGDVFIRFSLRLGDGMTSRAEGTTPETPATPNPPETVGFDNENVINTVDILAFDAADNTLCDAVFLDAEQVEVLRSPERYVIVPIMSAKGKTLHIYAAVNMPPQMRSKFIYGQSITDLWHASTATDYWNVMNEFVPGSNGKLEKEHPASFSIPMTGQFKITGVTSGNVDPYNITVTGEHSKRENPLEVKADLSRMVAKVHLLARAVSYTTADGKVTEYVYADDKSTAPASRTTNQDEFKSWIGWMLLSDVRYIINGINKSTYLFPQTDEAGNAKDRNMNPADYRTSLSFDKNLWGNDFTFYDGLSLHRANILNTDYFGKAEKYIDDRYNNTGTGQAAENRYVNGLYCPENYFTRPVQGDEADKFYSSQKSAMPVVTHLSIATKLVPRDLVVLTDFPDKLDKFFLEAKNRNTNAEFYKTYHITEEQLTNVGIDLDKDIIRWQGDEKVVNPEKPCMREYYFGTAEKPGAAVKKRNDFYLFSCRNIEEANCFINWSLIVRGLWNGDADNTNFGNSKWPKNTYFVYDTKYDDKASSVSDGDGWNRKYVYLVAGAVDLAKGDNIGIKLHSVPHVGGWGYYYTYIDNCGATAYGVTPYWASQVTRNTYYLITVDNFGAPGGTITDPEYIRVNTDPVSWDYVGRVDIDLY